MTARDSIERIYIEKGADRYPAARHIMSMLPGRDIVEINSYKSILDRKRQDPRFQRGHIRALVMGVKKGRFLYRQVRGCALPGYGPWYMSPVTGCLHDCSYCFVEKKYGCGHLVVFVNHEDFIRRALEALARKGGSGPPWISFGYDSELIAFSDFFPAPGAMLDALSGKEGELDPEPVVEIITKSSSREPFRNRRPPGNLVLAFSIAPREIWRKHERSTADPSARLETASWLLERGWRVALRVDPVLPVRNCAPMYLEFLEGLQAWPGLGRLTFFEIGALRYPGKSGRAGFMGLTEIGEADYRMGLGALQEYAAKRIPAPLIFAPER